MLHYTVNLKPRSASDAQLIRERPGPKRTAEGDAGQIRNRIAELRPRCPDIAKKRVAHAARQAVDAGFRTKAVSQKALGRPEDEVSR